MIFHPIVSLSVSIMIKSQGIDGYMENRQSIGIITEDYQIYKRDHQS